VDPSGRPVSFISELSEHLPEWTLKVRCTSKSEISGDGQEKDKCQLVFTDRSGNVHSTMWGKEASEASHFFQVGSVCRREEGGRRKEGGVREEEGGRRGRREEEGRKGPCIVVCGGRFSSGICM
jgi:hypothetical protein